VLSIRKSISGALNHSGIAHWDLRTGLTSSHLMDWIKAFLARYQYKCNLSIFRARSFVARDALYIFDY